MRNSFSSKMRGFSARVGLSAMLSNIVLSSVVSVLPAFTPIVTAATVNLAPSSAGNYDSQFTANSGTKTAAVATNDSDTTYITGTTTGHRQSFLFANAGIPTGAIVNNVAVTVVGKKVSSNSAFKILAENGTGVGQQDLDGSHSLTGGGYSSTTRTMTSNPFTTNDWTATEVNAWTVRFGVEQNDDDDARYTQIYVTVDYTVPTCNGLNATISGAGVINGTAGDDVIYGSSGVDTITGNGGNDTICSVGGNDTIVTGTGNDWIDAGDGANDVNAGSGDNTILSGSSNDSITTGDGNDNISAGNGTNVVNAGAGNNVITTGSGNDNVTVGDGNDTINAGDGANSVAAGNGTNTVTGGSGNDTVTSGTGDDTIIVGNGANNVHSGDGDDVISGGSGNDDFDGEAGTDACLAFQGTNTLLNCEPGLGSSGNNAMIVIKKDSIPDNTGEFDFTGSPGISPFTVNGDSLYGYGVSDPGGGAGTTYTITEGAESGWTRTGLTCLSIDGSSDSGTAGVVGTGVSTIKLNRGDFIVCTYTNTLTSGTLRVNKEAVGGDGTFSFTGAASFDITTSGGAGSHDITDLTPGSYTVNETA